MRSTGIRVHALIVSRPPPPKQERRGVPPLAETRVSAPLKVPPPGRKKKTSAPLAAPRALTREGG